MIRKLFWAAVVVVVIVNTISNLRAGASQDEPKSTCECGDNGSAFRAVDERLDSVESRLSQLEAR